MKTLALSAVAASLFLSGVAEAATVTIDTFTTRQSVTAPFAGASSVSSAIAAAEAIGGQRKITAVRTTPAAATAQTARTNVTAVGDGEALVSLAAQTHGYSVFEWSLGLPYDLIDGTNNRIDLAVLDADLPGISLTLSLDAVSVTKAVAGTGTLSFLFSEFAGANAGAVDKILLRVNGPLDFDFAMGPIVATGDTPVVPLPATGLLLAGAMGGVAALRRRRT